MKRDPIRRMAAPRVLAGWCLWVVASVTGVVTSGCMLFLPAHRNSDHREGETVEIELVPFSELGADQELVEDYKAAKPPESAVGLALPPIAVAIGAAGAGFVVDFLAREIEEEATRYEAQFEVKALKSDFWQKRERQYQQRYAAMRVIRKVKGEEAFRFACGFYPTSVEQLFVVAPLQFQTKKAKAKVLSDELWWWLLPTTWLGKILQHDEHEIDSTVAVEITGYWRGKDQELHVTKLAGFSLEFNGYDLDQTKKWRASTLEDNPTFPRGPQAFFVSAPLSYGRKEDGGEVEVVGLGAFMVEVLVTERDQSNARRYLKKLSELVAEQKGRIVEEVKEAGRP